MMRTERKRTIETVVLTLIPLPLFSIAAISIPWLESSVMLRYDTMLSISAFMISAFGFRSLRLMGKYSVTLWLALAACSNFPALLPLDV